MLQRRRDVEEDDAGAVDMAYKEGWLFFLAHQSRARSTTLAL